MVKYQRFVSYVYEYRKGNKENNCGFLRVENRNDIITVEIHMKCMGLPSDEKCNIYGFIRNGEQMEGIFLGSAWPESEKLDCIMESHSEEEDSWKKSFPQFGGIIICTERGAFWGTEWDDIPIRPDSFRSEKTVVQTELETELEVEEITEEPKTMEEAKTTEEPKITENAAFCPFDDDEITECCKLKPDAFFCSCPEGCILRNNPFLEHACYQFGHILTGKRADGYGILGVPGGYNQEEQFMASMFGFPYFKESREIQLQNGRGGYWYRLINPANFHKRNSFQKNLPEML